MESTWGAKQQQIHNPDITPPSQKVHPVGCAGRRQGWAPGRIRQFRGPWRSRQSREPWWSRELRGPWWDSLRSLGLSTWHVPYGRSHIAPPKKFLGENFGFPGWNRLWAWLSWLWSGARAISRLGFPDWNRLWAWLSRLWSGVRAISRLWSGAGADTGANSGAGAHSLFLRILLFWAEEKEMTAVILGLGSGAACGFANGVASGLDWKITSKLSSIVDQASKIL